MNNTTCAISEMTNLQNRLGDKLSNKIRYEHDPTPVKRGKNITNTVLYEMQARKPSDPFCEVSDVIAGVCRLDHYGQTKRNIPLSQVSVYMILQTMENINTREVKKLLNVSDKQAQVYVRAVEDMIPFIECVFEDMGEDFLEFDDGT